MKVLDHRYPWHKTLLVSLTIIPLYFLSACQKVPEDWTEEVDPTYKRGQQLLREGREKDALEKFLEIIHQHDATPKSHLFCGKIYWETLEDPIFAIYHFRQFLMCAAENAKEREWVPQWINSAQKLFMKQCHNRSLCTKYANNFPVLLQGLRKENSQLKLRMLELEKQLEKSSHGQNAKHESKEETGLLGNYPLTHVKTYVVQEGDTLSIISQKVFGDASRWPAIFDANKDQLSRPDQVRIGQRLVLPSNE
ncbi:MAG: LysM peptidoglycan-binding domain-containing protein [Puniceicoccales bacterium]|jgi:hypothetical protein|nr:LysM peptidoglycan-binding domain-containing protein [Puniceicoccales bacterium]